MINFFSSLFSRLKPEAPKAMSFPVGQGVETEPARAKMAGLATKAPKLKQNFFADVIRDFPRSVAGLALKATGQEEEYDPSLGTISPKVEKFIFGTEPIKQPKGMFETGLFMLGAIPVVPGKKQVIQKGKKILPDILEPLAKEARKYKSVKKFMKSQKPIYHGTPVKFKEFDISKMEGGQAWFTTSKKDIMSGRAGAVQAKGQKLMIMERYIKPGLKFADEKTAEKLYTDQLIQQGYAGKIVKQNGINWYSLFNPNKDLITKSQLIDTYTQATKAVKQVFKKAPGTKALKTSEKATEVLGNLTKGLADELATIKGKTLTHREVIESAKTSDILKKVTTRTATLKREARILKTKQHLAHLAEKSEITPEFVKTLKSLSSEATSLGRQLNSLKIEALPEALTFKSKVVKKLLDTGIEADKIIDASKGIDFNNADEVSDFYRKFVKPTLSETIDEYRYINLLSSPKTHIVNAFSNLMQATITAPSTKLYSGGIDLISSALNKAPRQYYISEVPAYYKGMFNSMGDAVSETFKVIKGQKAIFRPDVKHIPTKSKVLAPFQIVPRMLEAGDVFFRTLITGAEKEALALKAFKQGKKGISVLNKIDKEAIKKAEYYVFRSPLDTMNQSGQGKVLTEIDKLTKAVYGFRNVPGVKWFVPFVATPMNILKQGLEYSPLGITTLAGHTKKTEQLAKALVGSTIFAGAGYLAAKGDSTWSVPVSKKERDYFYASGRQPYSMKIGDNWVSYSRVGPLAYPVAMASAVKQYFEDNPKAGTESNLRKTSQVLSGIAGFFSDQSYVQGIGDVIDLARGDEYAGTRALSNLPSQLIPLASLERWVAQLIDPIYRKSEKDISAEAIIKNLKKGIPFLSKELKPYTDPFREESKRQFPITNALSPLGITIEKKEFEELYQLLLQQKKASAEIEKIKKDLRKELGL